MAPPAPNPPNQPTRHEMTYRGRKVVIQEDASGCEVTIDGKPVGIHRLAPGSYHSHILTHQEYPTAEALAKALVDTEGKLWRLPAQGGSHHGHGSS